MTESAPPLGPHRYLQESLGRKEVTQDGVAASENILTSNRTSENVASRVAGRQLYLALLEEAGLEDPTNLE
jgi:hypothetical protein